MKYRKWEGNRWTKGKINFDELGRLVGEFMRQREETLYEGNIDRSRWADCALFHRDGGLLGLFADCSLLPCVSR